MDKLTLKTLIINHILKQNGYDIIIILFSLFSALLCDSNGILNLIIEQVEQKLAINTIYDFIGA